MGPFSGNHSEAYMPGKWEALEIQDRKNKSKETPDGFWLQKGDKASWAQLHGRVKHCDRWKDSR